MNAYSAIGNIAAQYFYISVKPDSGSLDSYSSIKHYVHYDSDIPKLEKHKIPDPPKDWSPQVAEPIVYNNMHPYVYEQEKRVPYVNLPGEKFTSNQI